MAQSENKRETELETPHLGKARFLWNCFNAAAAVTVIGGLGGGALLSTKMGVAAGLGAFFLTLAAVPVAAVGLQAGMKRVWPEIAEDVSRMEFGNRYYWGSAIATALITATLLANAGEESRDPAARPPAARLSAAAHPAQAARLPR